MRLGKLIDLVGLFGNSLAQQLVAALPCLGEGQFDQLLGNCKVAASDRLLGQLGGHCRHGIVLFRRARGRAPLVITAMFHFQRVDLERLVHRIHGLERRRSIQRLRGDVPRQPEKPKAARLILVGFLRLPEQLLCKLPASGHGLHCRAFIAIDLVDELRCLGLRVGVGDGRFFGRLFATRGLKIRSNKRSEALE